MAMAIGASADEKFKRFKKITAIMATELFSFQKSPAHADRQKRTGQN